MSDPESVPSAFVDLACRLTEVSRPILRRYYRKKLDIIDKADESPVTKADRECEAALREAIVAAFPEHGIIGEEFGAERADAEYVWVLDPLDGTRSFITGRPLFGTLIALTRAGAPILGVIDMPILGDLFLGVAGRPSTLNGEPIRARPCAGLADAYFSTISPLMFKGEHIARFERLSGQAKSTTFGGDCYQYAMVATGFIDLVVERGLGIYDYLALVPVIEGAGGFITDWRGQALTMKSEGAVIAAGDRRILDQTVATLGA
ncbi:histidinol-phosphatase [Dongia sedimenti]|uniref:Histidinol-phosphatase n=1 Tax=Dongia sedimenti TaxID=3064282 RepID=A0ABU0YS28_9PROT|nr:histidinol-phosphatase [Rhodospirillaceae bacterium R-7]